MVQGITIYEFTARVNEFNRRSMELWNERALETFCKSYAIDATYLSKDGPIQGRESIQRLYQKLYRDRSRMGRIEVTLLELRFPPAEAKRGRVSMGTALVLWQSEISSSEREEGHSLVTFVLERGKLVIVQDASP